MTRHKNMTQKNLKAILDAMPDEMTDGEICALTLTIHTAYMRSPSAISGNLISAVVTHAMSQGLRNDEIAEVFSVAARAYRDPSTAETEH